MGRRPPTTNCPITGSDCPGLEPCAVEYLRELGYQLLMINLDMGLDPMDGAAHALLREQRRIAILSDAYTVLLGCQRSTQCPLDTTCTVVPRVTAYREARSRYLAGSLRQGNGYDHVLP